MALPPGIAKEVTPGASSLSKCVISKPLAVERLFVFGQLGNRGRPGNLQRAAGQTIGANAGGTTGSAV